MSVSVLVEGILKDEFELAFPELCAEAFVVTRSFDGCQKIHLNLDIENEKSFVLNEVWDSEEHYRKYLNFRIQDGTIDLIKDMCSEGPNIRIFQVKDV